MILPQQQPGDMRADQADEADRADERDRCRRQRADAQQRKEAQPLHVDAEAARPVLPQAQRGHGMAGAQREGRDRRDDEREHDQIGPGRPPQRSHAPEDKLRQRFLTGDELDQRDQGIEGEDQSDAEQHDAFNPGGAAARQRFEQQHGCEGAQEGVHRHHPVGRDERQAQSHDDRERRAEGGGRRHAEGEWAGERIVEDGLHFRPRQRQGGAHEDGHQRIGQSDLADDRHLRIGKRRRIEQPGPDVAQRQRGRARGNIERESQAAQ